MEFGAGAGDDDFSGGGDHRDSADPHRSKKRYHRHTVHQIQRLEETFKECPHPDETTRTQLSRELGLTPRQIKFWFQNRRTQTKAQYERADNCALRAENHKIRCENITFSEALKNVICRSCGPSISEDPFLEEQRLRLENVQLKEQLERVSSMASKYIGRPISQLTLDQTFHVSPLDLSMSSYVGPSMGATPSLDLDLDLDLVPGSSTGGLEKFLYPTMSISDMDKSLMVDIASNAMGELIRLLQTNEPLWMKSADGSEVLNLESYERNFPRPNNHLKNHNVRFEASRDSGVVIMNATALVDMFLDTSKWMELFPTIVSRATTIEVISSSIMHSQMGTLQLMYEELQVLSPLVPTRKMYVLRLCQQIEQGSWAIVNISYDHHLPNQENSFSSSSCKAHRLPSGCLIQDMPNGYSKVTWVENWEIEDRAPTHRLYTDLILSGLAFGAERWLSTLQRACERFACFMVTGNSTRDIGGVIPSSEGKRSMMKLAQRMVNNFCASIHPSNGEQWTTLSGPSNEFEVRVTLRRSTDPVQPNAVVLSAATTIWLPISASNIFNFLRDERSRQQWDVLSNQNSVQEVAHIANGAHPGNCISILRAINTNPNMLILQESCTDLSGSLVVYSPVDLQSINIAMSGADSSCTALLPSGFTISPDGRQQIDHRASTSSHTSIGGSSSSGSLITIVLQILVSNLPSAKMSQESVTTVTNLISNTTSQIKAALNCTNSP